MTRFLPPFPERTLEYTPTQPAGTRCTHPKPQGRIIHLYSVTVTNSFTQGKPNSVALHGERTLPRKNQHCSNNAPKAPWNAVVAGQLLTHLPAPEKSVDLTKGGFQAKTRFGAEHSQTLPPRRGPGSPLPAPPVPLPRYLSGSRET